MSDKDCYMFEDRSACSAGRLFGCDACEYDKLKAPEDQPAPKAPSDSDDVAPENP